MPRAAKKESAMSDWAKIQVLEPLVDRFTIDLEEGMHIVDPARCGQLRGENYRLKGKDVLQGDTRG